MIFTYKERGLAGYLTDRNVTVIGAGIGGLTAALAFARYGAKVSIHERAAAFGDVGAGIQISPNAGTVLDALGLSSEIDGVSVRAEAVVLQNDANRPVARLDLLHQRPDATFRFLHRARLIDILASAAAKAGVDIHLASQIDAPSHADLVVAADGLHSTHRTNLNGTSVPFFTGQTAWRALIPDERGSQPIAQVFMGVGRHLVSYPLANGLRNIVAVLETRDWVAEGWSMPGDVEAMRLSLIHI